MKFESKFGIGEIVENNTYKDGRLISSHLYKIVSVIFDSETVVYYGRHPETGQMVGFREDELIGDPDYDQDLGSYHSNKSEND